jgi:hypothetical protein
LPDYPIIIVKNLEFIYIFFTCQKDFSARISTDGTQSSCIAASSARGVQKTLQAWSCRYGVMTTTLGPN